MTATWMASSRATTPISLARLTTASSNCSARWWRGVLQTVVGDQRPQAFSRDSSTNQCAYTAEGQGSTTARRYLNLLCKKAARSRLRRRAILWKWAVVLPPVGSPRRWLAWWRQALLCASDHRHRHCPTLRRLRSNGGSRRHEQKRSRRRW